MVKKDRGLVLFVTSPQNYKFHDPYAYEKKRALRYFLLRTIIELFQHFRRKCTLVFMNRAPSAVVAENAFTHNWSIHFMV
jgi:hypothetical protein